MSLVELAARLGDLAAEVERQRSRSASVEAWLERVADLLAAAVGGEVMAAARCRLAVEAAEALRRHGEAELADRVVGLGLPPTAWIACVSEVEALRRELYSM